MKISCIPFQTKWQNQFFTTGNKGEKVKKKTRKRTQTVLSKCDKNLPVILFIPPGSDIRNSQMYLSLCILRAESAVVSEYFLRMCSFKCSSKLQPSDVKCLVSIV